MEINISDLLFAAVNFLVLMFILNKLLFKPVMGILDQRQQQVEEMQTKSEIIKIKAEKSQSAFDAKIADANKKAQNIINKAVMSGEQSRNTIVEEAKVNAQHLLEKASKEIIYEKEKMKLELRNEVAVLAVMAAGKILKKSMNAKDHDQLIQEFINEYLSEHEVPRGIYQDLEPLVAEVYTSVALKEEQKQALIKNLSQNMGTIVSLKIIEDENIIGGLIIKIGDIVINGSVANKLIQMQEQLLQA